MIRDMASTMVVIKGEAITAGSAPIFFARRGMVQPTTLAQTMVRKRVKQTTAATVGVMP